MNAYPMTRICACGHAENEHYQGRGLCESDVFRAELGRSFGCFCPQFDLDYGPNRDQNRRQKGV